MVTRTVLILLLLASIITSCTETKTASQKKESEIITQPTNKVVLSSEIEWEQLNPARGDQSPKAGTIWGDRKGTVATGFLAKFVDGFSSPPHIHNVTYRAMVLKGLIHNDDPAAEKMWMPAGSFWTQPAGESHITAAKGEEVIAYVEIDSGPYLVKPVSEAFDNGERPVNIDKGNLIWLDASAITIIDASKSAENPEIAYLWKNKDMTGYLTRFPTGFEGKIHSDGAEFHAVVIEGEPDYVMPSSKEIKPLDPGSYFTSKGKSIHHIKVTKGLASTIYIRTNGKIHIQ